jgi:hypothetical protein
MISDARNANEYLLLNLVVQCYTAAHHTIHHLYLYYVTGLYQAPFHSTHPPAASYFYPLPTSLLCLLLASATVAYIAALGKTEQPFPVSRLPLEFFSLLFRSFFLARFPMKIFPEPL